MDDSDSDLSSALSSPPPEEELLPPPKTVLKLVNGKLTRAPATNPTQIVPLSPSPEPQREPSPPHEYVLADNPDIAFIVAFRKKFTAAFPKNVPNLGPQDVEKGVVETNPSENVENLLCALLGLVLNRKKYVERGHHGRALEEAISTQKSQWPRAWQGANPISGSKSFQTMDPTERILLLKTLVLWSLSSSELIGNIIKDFYKQRHDDDLNQPLAIHPHGSDGLKRRYWMIEGDVDTPFRIYRESNPKRKENTWWSVAESIEELQSLSITLREDKSQAARRLADRLISEVPRLEEVEEKRKRKEYRQARKAAFSRPEPGFSLYEGRTRGKRMKYTFSDEEEDDNDGLRRSSRQVNKDATHSEETVTASGRHVRSRFGRSYGDALDSSSEQVSEGEVGGRAQRAARRAGGGSYEMSDDSGDDGAQASGDDWDGDANEAEDEDEDEVMSDAQSDDSLMDSSPRSLVVTLKYKPGQEPNGVAEADELIASDPMDTFQQSSPVKDRPAFYAAPTPGSDAEKPFIADSNTASQPSMYPQAGSFSSHWGYTSQHPKTNGTGIATPSALSSRQSPPAPESYSKQLPPATVQQPLTPNTDVSHRSERLVKPAVADQTSPSKSAPLTADFEHKPVVLSPKPAAASKIDVTPHLPNGIDLSYSVRTDTP